MLKYKYILHKINLYYFIYKLYTQITQIYETDINDNQYI